MGIAAEVAPGPTRCSMISTTCTKRDDSQHSFHTMQQQQQQPQLQRARQHADLQHGQQAVIKCQRCQLYSQACGWTNRHLPPPPRDRKAPLERGEI
ncbi:hypothetical protein ACLKA7_012416 [Drosophila subpalustris]